MKNKNSDIPKLSVILPVYNGEKFLKESLLTILNQTFRDFELIIINDGSKDQSADIIKEFKDPRIKLLTNKENIGSAATINKGFKSARGKYIACCTQDDLSHPKRFEVEYNYLENHPNIFLVGTSAIYIDERGNEIRRYRKYDDYRLLAWRLRKSNGIIFPSIMFRNKDVSFDDYFEYNFYYNLIKRGENLTNIPLFLVKYRIHSQAESIQTKNKQEILRDEVKMKFSKLKSNLNIFQRIYSSTKLLLHYIRTMKEKKIKPLSYLLRH